MSTDRNSVIHGNQIKDRTVTKAELDATSETIGYVLTVQANGSVDWEASTGGGTTYKTTFVNADLTSSKITITHNLNTEHPVVAIYDNSDNIILPTEVTYKTVNTIELDFTDMTPLTGTYKVRVIGSGGIVGHTIQDADNDTKIETEKNPDEDKIRFTTLGTQRALFDANGLALQTGADINEFSIDGTLAGNSDDAVPTEKAIKTYVDALKPSDLNISGQTTGDRLVYNGSNWIRKETCEFSAYLIGNYTLPDNNFNTVSFDGEVFDTGNNFNTSTYTFTAPITGKYFLSASLYWASIPSNANNISLKIVTSNRSYYTVFYMNQIGGGLTGTVSRHGQNLSFITDMDAGDTAFVECIIGVGTTGTVNIDDGVSNASGSRFTGYLIA